MPYVGRGTDKLSNVEVLDNITFDGSSSYTLQKGGSNFTPSSANTLLVSIDGVVQAGNFTVSGSTIDFGTAVAGTSTCDFILHYGIGLITTPSDGTVTTAKLADSSVSLAKLTATGTKDATTFLRGDNTFAEAGGGIEEVDCFGVNDLNINTFTSYTLTSSNTSRISSFSNQTFSKTGTGITIDSNGKVAFPSTGTYYITFDTMFSVLSTTSVEWVGGIIRGTTDDGSNIYDLAENFTNSSSSSGNTDLVGITTSLLFTVSDTSNDKVYFQAVSATSANAIRLGGSDPTLKTKFTIIKLV